MKDKQKLSSLPKLKTDKAAEDFVSYADLTKYDFSRFKPMKFEFTSKSARINMRLPETLLIRIKEIAEERNLPYTRFIREVLETVVSQEQSRK